jgi:hypothetical protein
MWQSCAKTQSIFTVEVSFRTKSRCPLFFVDRRKCEEVMGGLESSRRLAKQVHSRCRNSMVSQRASVAVDGIKATGALGAVASYVDDYCTPSLRSAC